MTLFQKVQEAQRKAEERGDIGPMPNDAIGVLRSMNTQRLCDDLESHAAQERITLKQIVERVPWNLISDAYQFSDTAHELIKQLANA